MKKVCLLLMPGMTALLLSCGSGAGSVNTSTSSDTLAVVQPAYITEPVAYDSDDPAVWVNPTNPAQSLILGTDKDANGGLYVFNLEGKIQHDKVVKGLQRPNNVDVAYGLVLNGKPTDIAVVTERNSHKLRVFSVPDMKPVDNGGLDMFTGETGDGYRDIMGIALYKNKQGDIYAIVGRKTGPVDSGYLWQYLLKGDDSGYVKATLVRKFGKYSGKKEIESIAVDPTPGYVYYSDEQYGVRQYFADPAKGNQELAVFGTTGFAEDHEGISIYQLTDSTGYILVSDQGANRFQVFTREGSKASPYGHTWLKTVPVTAMESDGSETVTVPLGAKFPHGMFVAMSTDKTFHIYRWEDIAGKTLQVR